MLGIARDASPAAVKSAYFRLARVHTPEDAPDRFREISRAYGVLSDPEARKRYDAEERLPVPVAVALQQSEALAARDKDAAVAAAKAVLPAHGRSALVRYTVALACLRAERPKAAIPLAEELTREAPSKAEYAHFLGDAYLADGRVDDADRALKVALSLDASRLGVYLSLAQAHNARSRPDDALLVLDRGLRTDEGATLRTLPLRVRKLTILAQDGRWDEMERVVTSIQSSVPSGDPDAAQHAAWQLSQVAQQYDAMRVYDVAKFLIDAALRLAPHEGLAGRSREIAEIAAAQREARVVYRDGAVAAWVKAVVGGRLGAAMPDEEWRKLCNDVVEAIARDVGRADREWKTFRGLYPRVAQECQDLFGKLRDAAVKARAAGRRGTRREKAVSSGSGWIGGLGVAIIMVFVKACIDRPDFPSRPPSSTYLDDYMRKVREESDRRWEKMSDEERRKLLDKVMPPERFRRPKAGEKPADGIAGPPAGK